MRYVTGFFRFWYDFLVGDSWQITVGVVVVVIVTRTLIIAAPRLAAMVQPGFSLALLAVLCGVILNEHRKPGPPG